MKKKEASKDAELRKKKRKGDPIQKANPQDLAATDPITDSEEELSQNTDSISIDEATKTSILKLYRTKIKSISLLYSKETHNMKVYKIELDDNKEYVLKTKTLASSDKESINSIYQEFHIGKIAVDNSDYAIKYLDIKEQVINSANETVVETLMEYGGQTLESLSRSVNFDDAIVYGYHLLLALERMHEIGIAHLDVKPENAVFDKHTQRVKLIDFGSAISFYPNYEEMAKPGHRLKECTPCFAPPEVLSCIKNKRDEQIFNRVNLEKVDVFSYGMTLYELLLSGAKRIANENIDKIEQHSEFVRKIYDNLSRSNHLHMVKLVGKCLGFTPESRRSFKEIRKDYEDILTTWNLKSIIQPTKIIKKQTRISLLLSFLQPDRLQTFNPPDKRSTSYKGIKITKNDLYKIFLQNASNYPSLGLSTHLQKVTDVKKIFREYKGDLHVLSKLHQEWFEKNKISTSSSERMIKFLRRELQNYRKVGAQNNGLLGHIYIQLGFHYLNIHEFKTCLKYCIQGKKLIKTTAKDQEKDIFLLFVYLVLIEANLSLGNWQKTLSYCKKGKYITKNKGSFFYAKHQQLKHYEGVSYLQMGKYQKAQKCCEASERMRKTMLGESAPSFLSVYLKIVNNASEADLRACANELQIREKLLSNQFCQDYNSLLDVRLNLYVVYIKLNEAKIALRYIKKVVKLCGFLGQQKLSSWCSLHLVIAYYNARQLNKAKVLFSKLHLETYSDFPGMLYVVCMVMGVICLWFGDHQNAIQVMEKSLELSNRCESPYLNGKFRFFPYLLLGDAYFRLNCYEEAIEYCSQSEEYLQGSGNEQYLETVLLQKGLSYHYLGRSTLCLSYLGRLDKKNPLLSQGFLGFIYGILGDEYSKNGDHKLAINSYLLKKKTLKNTFQGNSLFFELGKIYYELGEENQSAENYDNAKKYYHKAILNSRRISDETNIPKRSSYAYSIGTRCSGQYKFTEASYRPYEAVHMKEILSERDLDLANSYTTIIFSHFGLKQYKRGCKCFRKLDSIVQKRHFDRDPGRFVVCYTMVAYIYIIRKKTKAALYCIQQALAMAEKSMCANGDMVLSCIRIKQILQEILDSMLKSG